MRSHQIKTNSGDRVLDILEYESGTTILGVTDPASDMTVGLPLDRGQQIGLAFAALGGGSINLSDEVKSITEAIGDVGGDLTDEDLIVVARRALRALSNRRKKYVAVRKAVTEIGDTLAANKIFAPAALIEDMARAGLRVQK